MSKITLSTVKSLLRNNPGNIWVLKTRDFDGMIDGCRSTGQKSFVLAQGEYNPNCKNTFGLDGLWFVGGSRDYFTAKKIETREGTFEGIEVYNCCGTFTVAKKV